MQRLEARAAERMGKEAGLYVTSGTQGNLIGVLAQTAPGQEVILDLDSHVYNYEVAGAALIGGVQMRPVKTTRGFLTPDQIAEAVAPRQHPPAGQCPRLPGEHPQPARWHLLHARGDRRRWRRRHTSVGSRVHLDGARLFNAAVALRRDRAGVHARGVDSVTFCLSKGLAAPVGSVVCGSARLRRAGSALAKAAGRRHAPGRRDRRGRAGGPGHDGRSPGRRPRQRPDPGRGAGAAARPHHRSRAPSRRTSSSSTSTVRRPRRRAADLVRGCAERKVKVHAIGPASIRCVTHKDVDADDIARAIQAFREVAARW